MANIALPNNKKVVSKKSQSYFRSKYKKKIVDWQPSSIKSIESDKSDFEPAENVHNFASAHHRQLQREQRASKFYDLAEIQNIAFKKMNLKSPTHESN